MGTIIVHVKTEPNGHREPRRREPEMATKKTYTIEIMNPQWQTTVTKNDRFYFTSHMHPRIKRFRTQKAAREWMAANGFEPWLKNAKRPTIFLSGQRGMTAKIVVDNGKDEPMMLGTEGAMQRRIMKAYN